MKKLSFLILLIFNFSIYSQKDSLTISGTLLLTNNGIDPVPAYALGKPALMSNLYIAKGHFLYNGQVNYGLDFKPWAVNNWFFWKIPVNEKSYFRTGLALDFFFKRDRIDYLNRINAPVTVVNQYITFDASYWYTISPNTSLQLVWWHDQGFTWDGLKSGNYFSASANFNNIPISKSLNLHLNPNLFYLKNTSPQQGLLISETSSLSYRTFPISFFVQTVLPIAVTPKNEFIWNCGLIFKY